VHTNNDLIIVLLTPTNRLQNKYILINKLTIRFPHIKSIVQNVNEKRTNVILGEKTKVLWGETYIYDKIGDITFAISAKSFYQVNPIQTKVLYDKALEFANIGSDDVV
ncbi:23S rRNA (uracil-5-)-methyltransferase RumA, partial [Staphylococcus sp. SIMBA_130]